METSKKRVYGHGKIGKKHGVRVYLFAQIGVSTTRRSPFPIEKETLFGKPKRSGKSTEKWG